MRSARDWERLLLLLICACFLTQTHCSSNSTSFLLTLVLVFETFHHALRNILNCRHRRSFSFLDSFLFHGTVYFASQKFTGHLQLTYRDTGSCRLLLARFLLCTLDTMDILKRVFIWKRVIAQDIKVGNGFHMPEIGSSSRKACPRCFYKRMKRLRTDLVLGA